MPPPKPKPSNRANLGDLMKREHLLKFAKGHGTGNDFVVLVDLEDRLNLTATEVARLCDRHQGIGADGLLRVLPTRLAAEESVRELSPIADWFMDYYNADGSQAEMCGNGVRVFAHYLWQSGLAIGDSLEVATRGGVKSVSKVEVNGEVLYRVMMGQAEFGEGADLKVANGAGEWPARSVFLPNPHAVVMVDDLSTVGSIEELPTFSPTSAFTSGANFEFVQVIAPQHVRMIVHERGVGPTLSCGTGACAAALVAAEVSGFSSTEPIQVEVPGGTLWVQKSENGEVSLTGPAVLVAEGHLLRSWED